MTQTVTLEDGSVHNFPDDATLDEMNAALPPAPAPIGAMQNFSNAATKGYNDLGLGILSAGANMGSAIGYIPQEQADQNKQLFAQAKQGLDTQYPTQPGVSRWLGSTIGENAPAFLMPGGPFAAGAALGTTSALSKEDPTISGGDQALDVGKTALTYGAISKLGDMALNGLTTLGSKTINSLRGARSPIMQAYDTAGITPRLVGDVTGDQSAQLLQGIAAKLPFGSNQIESAAQKTMDEFGDSVESTASQMGKSTTLQEAGNALQDSGSQWLKDFKTKSSANWNAVDAMIGKDTSVPLVNTKVYLDNITAQGGNNPAAQDFLTSDLAKKFQNIVNVSDKTGVPVTWDTIKGLRTRAGQYLENPQLIPDAGAAQAKGLYASLTEDMKNAVQSSSDPKASALFDNANQFTSQGHDFIDNVLGKAMKQTPEQAASSLLQSGLRGGTQLQALRYQMPDAADELGAASIRRMAAGQSEGSTNAVSPSRWLSNQDPVRRISPEAKAALFDNPAVQEKMSALDTVASSMRASEKFANPSGSAGHLGTWAAVSFPFEGAAYGGYEGQKEGGFSGGVKGALAGGLMGTVPLALGAGIGAAASSQALAKFLSTPATNLPFSFAPSITSALSRSP